MNIEHVNEDDEVIVVTMPKSDYRIMRELIADRKSSTRVMGKLKTFSLTLSGVVAAWIFLGESALELLKGWLK